MKRLFRFLLLKLLMICGINPLLAQWVQTNGSYGESINALAVSGTNLFAGTDGRGVFLSTNNGASWTEANTGLTNHNIRVLAVSGTNLFAGTYGGGVWRRPLSEMITTVERLWTDLPTHFSLDQNYPNPFNPSTRVRFGIPKSGMVSLKVFDLLGRELETLVAEELAPGYYEAVWKANVASGIYFYRIQAGDFVQTKKMILLH